MKDFLIYIKETLDKAGHKQVVSGLSETQQAAQKLSKTKITTTFDSAGLASGKQIEETFTKVNTEIKKAPGLYNKMGEAMGRALTVAPVWMALRGAMLAVIRTISDQVKFLVDLETEMTRIKIVGKGTEEEYKNLQNALVGLAYTYGTTASEAADAAVLFAQQGYEVKKTIELTRAAMLASKILGTDIKTAVDDMTAAIEGFGIATTDATDIVDKWINVEKLFAVTSKDLADATKVAGATANQLGMTISEFLGDVTAVVEVTRKSGSEAARGLSFLYARLYTTAKDTIQQIAKIPFYLDDAGRATNAFTPQLRGVADILGELAIKWNTLTREERLQIAESLGSKRQMVVVNALMQNYNTSLDARIVALTSAGSAEKAFNLIQDTTTTKVKQLGAAFNVLAVAIGDTSGFKATISGFEQWIIGITSLIDYSKAFQAVYTKQINQSILANETRMNEIKSFEELIAVRKKLTTLPQTEENANRIKQVQDAIDVVSAKEPKLKIALDLGNPEELKNVVQNRLDTLTRTGVTLNVSQNYMPQIAAVEDKIEDLKRQLQWTGGTEGIKISKEKTQQEQKLKLLYDAQNVSIEEQYKLQKGQQIAKKIMQEADENDLDLAKELTETELEKIEITEKINKAKESGLLSTSQQLALEIDLVKNSKFQYKDHEQNLKITELESQKRVAGLTDMRKIIDAELEIGKIRGLNNSELLKVEGQLNTMLYGENAVNNSLDYRLKILKEQTREMMNQVDVSSETMTLYKISKEAGYGVAKQIGSFLTGGIDFNELKQMPRVLEAFKKYFPQKFEAFQSAEYFGIPFRGSRGGAGAPGAEIPVQELNAPILNLKDMQFNANTTIQNVQIQLLQAIKDAGGSTTNIDIILKNIANKIEKDPAVRAAIEKIILSV